MKVISFRSSLTDRAVGFAGCLLHQVLGRNRANGKSPREESREQGRHGELCVARAHWGGSILCWGVAGYCSYDRTLGAHWAPARRAGRPEEMAEVVASRRERGVRGLMGMAWVFREWGWEACIGRRLESSF